MGQTRSVTHPEAGELNPSRAVLFSNSFAAVDTKASRSGYFPFRGAIGESVSQQSASQWGLSLQSPGSGRKKCAAGGFGTCLPGGAAGTGNAQEGAESGSHTLTLLTFDTTYREGQRLRVCQGEAGMPTLTLVFGLLTSAVVLLHNLAGLGSALHTPCPTHELKGLCWSVERGKQILPWMHTSLLNETCKVIP